MVTKVIIEKNHTVQYDSLSPSFSEMRKHTYIKLDSEEDIARFTLKFNNIKLKYDESLEELRMMDEIYIKKVKTKYEQDIAKYNKMSFIMRVLTIFNKPTYEYYRWELPSYEVYSDKLYICICDVVENMEKLNYEPIPEDFYLKIMKD